MKAKQKYSDKCNFEEYFAIVEKPYYLGLESEGLTPKRIAKSLFINDEITFKQMEYVSALANADTGKSTSAAMNNIKKYLIKNGYDSIVYVNKTTDSGSLTLIVFDEKQLIPVSVNGLPIKDDIKSSVDSNGSALFIPKKEPYISDMSNTDENKNK